MCIERAQRDSSEGRVFIISAMASALSAAAAAARLFGDGLDTIFPFSNGTRKDNRSAAQAGK